MSVEAFLILLTSLSAVSSLITEGLKKALHGCKYNPNILVAIVSIVTGCGGTAIYYIYNGFIFTDMLVITMILMAIAVWLIAMVGYDKVIQTIKLFGGGK